MGMKKCAVTTANDLLKVAAEALWAADHTAVLHKYHVRQEVVWYMPAWKFPYRKRYTEDLKRAEDIKGS